MCADMLTASDPGLVQHLKHTKAKDEQECSLCVCSLLSVAKSPGCDMTVQTGTDQQPLEHEVKDQVKCAFLVDGGFARS